MNFLEKIRQTIKISLSEDERQNVIISTPQLNSLARVKNRFMASISVRHPKNSNVKELVRTILENETDCLSYLNVDPL